MNFEVICINEASEDATSDILRNFQKADICEHAGAAYSGNRGLQVAEEYKIRQPEDIIGKVQIVAVCTSLIYREVVRRLK